MGLNRFCVIPHTPAHYKFEDNLFPRKNTDNVMFTAVSSKQGPLRLRVAQKKLPVIIESEENSDELQLQSGCAAHYQIFT